MKDYLVNKGKQHQKNKDKKGKADDNKFKINEIKFEIQQNNELDNIIKAI